MKNFIKVKNFGKGFITHEDQSNHGLRFKCRPGDIVEINGEQNEIDNWNTRVSGIKMNDAAAIAIVNTKIDEGRSNRVKELEAKIINLKQISNYEPI